MVLIVTGAPAENMEFEEVDYWKEITEIMDWSETHVTSTIFCAAGGTGISIILRSEEKTASAENVWSVLASLLNRKIPLVRGFDEVFLAPHSDILKFPSMTSVRQGDHDSCRVR